MKPAPPPRRTFLQQTITLAAAIAAPGAAYAIPTPQTKRALLIGVSEYPTLSRQQQLTGPRNDVKAWLEYFSRANVPWPAKHIQVLADGIDHPGALLPTRANILASLDHAALHASAGDFQLVYFAGHGSQVAQPTGSAHTEIDGLDEIFLPRDIGRWDGRAGQVTNAIMDDEIGDRLDAMRAKGCDVLAIFDCCHAATMARADFGVRVRGVASQLLGIPGQAKSGAAPLAKKPAPPLTRSSKLPGALSVFYAAHGFQAATEEMLPKLITPDTATIRPQYRGVFSFHLHEVLKNTVGDISRQDALRTVAADLTIRYQRERRVSPVPRFEFVR